jgi:hypothetical protein
LEGRLKCEALARVKQQAAKWVEGEVAKKGIGEGRKVVWNGVSERVP